MNSIGFYEARIHLPELLDQVANGKKVLITRRGKPAAVLVPPPEEIAKDVKKTIEEFKEYSKRQGRTLGGQSFRELIEEEGRF